MLSLRKCIALSLFLLTLSLPGMAQLRAYAPEDLRSLSNSDQVRVISLEYSEQSGGRSIPDDQLRFYIDQINRSNWNFSQVKADIAKSLGGNPGPQPTPGITIRCESKGSRYRTCHTPWQGESQLQRQISNTACTEGRTWGSKSGQIWVSHGCRGEFAAAGNSIAPYTVTCSDTELLSTNCAWDQSRGRPYLLQQLSTKPCIEGLNWGYDTDSGLWVRGGCSARFGAK